MQQLLTDASRTLVPLVSRNKAKRGSGHTEYMTIFYVSQQSALVNVPEKLGFHDMASARQNAVLDKTAARSDGIVYAVKKRRGTFGRTLFQ